MPTLRYFAAVKDAAGVSEDVLEATTLADLLTQARSLHSDRFATVLARCSFVVDGDPVGGRDHASVALTSVAIVDGLPPFAGG